MPTHSDLVPDSLISFLQCPTPNAWLLRAEENLAVLLVDHANCEKKAAATAMNLMYRYVENRELLVKMSQLAREELLHFQQVVELLAERKIKYTKLSPSRYAAQLRKHISSNEQEALIDTLIIGAYIEARSCERFAGLVKVLQPLDAGLARYYRSLLKSEARHFEDYLSLAKKAANYSITAKIRHLGECEAELISSTDSEFRFHSGIPA